MTAAYVPTYIHQHTLHNLYHKIWQYIGMYGKPKFGSDSVFKNQTVQKFDIRSDSFLIDTAHFICKK